MKKINKILDENTLGRDFVVGDLHGSFDLLQMFLTFINFDKSKDRLISVGDLVDRGRKNLECLRLIKEPWFHMVLGNHEDMMMCGMAEFGHIRNMWFQNGGEWIDECTPDEVEEVKALCKLLEDMPLVITVRMSNDEKFHVMHAEFNENSPVDDHDMMTPICIEDMDKPNHWNEDGSRALWGRFKFRDIFAEVVDEHRLAKHVRGLVMNGHMKMFGPSLSTIFSGHTIVATPTRIGKQICIDTGAFFTGQRHWCGLTIVEPLTMKFWKVRDDVEEVSLLE